MAASKKERKKTGTPREGWEDGTPPPHRDFKERSAVLAVAHPWASASSFAVSRQFSQRPSCHLAFFPLSSFSLLLSLPLTHRSPRPRSETPLPSALLSLLLSPFCVTPLSSPRILVPRVGSLTPRADTKGGFFGRRYHRIQIWQNVGSTAPVAVRGHWCYSPSYRSRALHAEIAHHRHPNLLQLATGCYS